MLRQETAINGGFFFAQECSSLAFILRTTRGTIVEQSQPQLQELFSAFLARRQNERVNGFDTVAGGEVEPYESVPSQSVDARIAWEAATEVIPLLIPNCKAAKLPTGWAGLVSNLEPICAMPMAIGCFPQAVRDLLPLIRTDRLATIKQNLKPMGDDAGTSSWIEAAASSNDPAKWLLAASMLRLSGHADQAATLLKQKSKDIPTGWTDAFQNELATTAWFTGDSTAAFNHWSAMQDSTVKSFNLGMAELFTDRPQAAATHLKTAIAGLGDSSAWYHLGRLYLALAESR